MFTLKKEFDMYIVHLNTGIFSKLSKKFFWKELKNLKKKKHYFANMRIAEKVALGKSADITQNVRLNELFQNSKKSYMGFFLSYKGPSSTL